MRKGEIEMELISTQTIEGTEYKRMPAEGAGDACQLCAFYDVIMTPFQTRNICARPPEANCETPESIYFKRAE